MNNQQWQEGKRYKLKSETLRDFIDQNHSNKRIVSIIENEVFTVGSVSSAGRVLTLLEYSVDPLDLCYWFSASELKYFDLIENTTKEIPMTNTNNIRPVADIVVEFLDKLVYVSANDYTVTDMLYLNKDGAVLTTDFADFRGGKQIYEFITNRYDLLQQEAKHKKNNELMERKAKLEAELAEIDKELGDA